MRQIVKRASCHLVRRLAVLVLAGLVISSRLLSADDSRKPLPVEFNLSELTKVPEVFPTEEFAAEGVRAFFYEGQSYHEKPTRVFAYYGAPSVSEGTKVPAMVLIHGGGGTAFDRWVRVWTSRGYAAIAMDLCGCVPNGTYGNWKRHESGGPPGWDASFDQIDEALQEHWQWHAVSAVVRAHTLIRSFPEVDADRTGVTGISWGGYLAGLVAGVDQRFRFASPVYGCGYLGENSAWLPAFEKMGKEKAARWLALWDPSEYLPRVKMPILWVNGTNDFAYPMDSWQKSYRLPASPQTLCLRVRMPHGHGPAGENPEEIHHYANAILKKGHTLPKITGQGRESDSVWITWESPVTITKAELNYTLDIGKWQDRKWDSLAATLNTGERKATANLPPGARVYYFNIFDDRNCAVSSQHEVLSGQPKE
jgi:cephalosporin-C deacetylase-like acetyl esterase